MRFIEVGSASHPARLFIHGSAAAAESCCGAVGRIRDGKYVPGFVIDGPMGKGNRSVIEMRCPNIFRRGILSLFQKPFPKKSAALLDAYVRGRG